MAGLQHSRATLAWAIALGLAVACSLEETPFRPLGAPRRPPSAPKHVDPVVPDEVVYPKIDPASVKPLEVVIIGEPVGEGYPRVPVRMSAPLFSDRWLGLANGDMEFMGPRHIIVNRFRSRPDHLGEGDLVGNVLLDVETGEVVAEFRYGRYVQWDRGLAIVYKHGEDDRPYLLHAATGKFVLAVPEGTHPYVIGKNYELRFSANGPHIWITARDSDRTIHLYAWDKLDAPPELPNNPFPFAPERWDPLRSNDHDGDTEEVEAGPGAQDCTRAILDPPKGWVCLDAEDLEDSQPLSGGWRLEGDTVFNRDDGRGFDLSPLCPEAHPLFASIRRRSPPQLELFCQGDPSVRMLWTPPDRVRKFDPRYAERIRKDLTLLEDSKRDGFALYPYHPKGMLNHIDLERQANVVVGTDYACPELEFRHGTPFMSAAICNSERGAPLWSELRDDVHGHRSRRFAASVVVASPSGLAVAIVRRDNRDHVIRVSLEKQ